MIWTCPLHWIRFIPADGEQKGWLFSVIRSAKQVFSVVSANNPWSIAVKFHISRLFVKKRIDSLYGRPKKQWLWHAYQLERFKKLLDNGDSKFALLSHPSYRRSSTNWTVSRLLLFLTIIRSHSLSHRRLIGAAAHRSKDSSASVWLLFIAGCSSVESDYLTREFYEITIAILSKTYMVL